jgi:hypothetical protein
MAKKQSLFVKQHHYKNGKISVWIDDYEEAIKVWQFHKTDLIEPCLLGPLKTSPMLWRVDYILAGNNFNTLN